MFKKKHAYKLKAAIAPNWLITKGLTCSVRRSDQGTSD